MTGHQLRVLLESAGLTQRGAAAELRMNERTMRKYVAGDYPIRRISEYAIRWLVHTKGHQQ